MKDLGQKGFIAAIPIIIILIVVGGIAGAFIFLNIRSEGNRESSSLLKKEAVTSTQTESEIVVDSTLEAATLSSEISLPSGDCDSSCRAYIDAKIANLRTELLQKINSIPTQTVEKVTTSTSTSTSAQFKELFVSMGIGGSTQSISWTDVPSSDITFDSASYPGAKEFYFVAHMNSDAPDRTAYARIYDATSFVGVIGSDISTKSLTSTLVQSGKLTMSSGSRTLRVQVHSLNGNLAEIDNPRIKVVY